MSRYFKRILSLLLVLSMALSLCTTGLAADEPEDPDERTAAAELELEELDPATLHVKKLGEVEDGEEPLQEIEEIPFDKIVRVSIFLDEPATLDAGYAIEGVGSNRSAVSYRESLRRQQAAVTAAIEKATGRTLDVEWNMTLAVNAISANIRYGDMVKIGAVPSVKKVVLERQYEAPAGAGTPVEPNTANTSTGMVGASAAWVAGYTGAGSRIAIIDTGIDTSHQSFAEEPFTYAVGLAGATKELMTKAQVQALAGQLNSKSGNYVSAKIPYGYNYVDKNTTINHLSDTNGEHGSHVAGIAAANRFIGSAHNDAAATAKAVGMAPDAQLFVMKVFGAGGGAYDSDYMVAIEDAIVLDCDAVNLSLGSSVQGWTYGGEYQDILNNLTNKAHNEGMVVSISAGNSYALTDFLETDLYIDDVSMHTGGSPGTYVNSLCVAAAQNIGVTGTPLQFDGRNIFFTESSSKAAAMSSIAGTYSFVYIDALGAAADYTAVNKAVSLNGKIVIVNRGDISFAEKGNNAVDVKPKAVLVANNQPGTISMDLTDYTGSFPMASITKADADYIKSRSTKGTTGSYTYYTGQITVTKTLVSEIVSARENTEITDFSSWGVPGSLLMKPEITAPGGDIYSVFGTNKTASGTAGGSDQYELMSGTSMAAPHITGLAAVAAEYLRENPVEGRNADLNVGYSTRAILQSLLMSTATPMKSDGEYLSILQQGAGLADVNAAVNASSVVMMDKAYLTTLTGAAADGKVKVELGDDPDRSGSYTYSFTLYNLENVDLTFALRSDFFTQAAYTEDGKTFMDKGTTPLSADVRYTWESANSAAPAHDVDQDGDTDAEDAQAILDYLTGKRPVDGLALSAGEMDSDGALTTHDAHELLLALRTGDLADGVVPANGSRKVTVAVQINDVDEIYSSGAYIEGFTYAECKTADAEGKSYAHTHSIPVLGFYGSWTDPSMFDNMSYTDELYGADRKPYTLPTNRNYLRVTSGGTTVKFSGNPYMVEEGGFPADRLALNSRATVKDICYTLYRAAADTGYAVSKLDRIGGSVTEVLKSAVTGTEVSGIWYYQSQGAWQNTGSKIYTPNAQLSSYGLAEGDSFRLGFYAIPEYTAMSANGKYSEANAAVLDNNGFKALLTGNRLGKGAFVGYDFTVDDTAPVIESATLSGSTLSVTARDNRNLAYVAVLSLDGTVKYAEAAPGASTHTVSFDAADAIANAHGFVAAFAGDYAGNETAVAVKVNDNAYKEKTVYVLTDKLTAGEEYLIVSRNTTGSGVALGHSTTKIAANAVNVLPGIDETNGQIYIDSKDVAKTSVWSAESGIKLKNSTYFLRRNDRTGTTLQVSTTDSYNTWQYSNRQLHFTDRATYLCYNNGFSLTTTQSNIYLYVKRTVRTEIDPYNPTGVTVTPNQLDLYKGNTWDLTAKVIPLTATDRTVTWSSSNTNVAVVDANGTVTAKSAGTATITATANGNTALKAACTVTVVSVDKTLNGIIWDEEGGVYFSSFNASSLPGWNKLHSTKQTLPLTSAFMQSNSNLYAATLDTGSASTVLYSVNRSSYALTEYGTNYVLATDMAIGASKGTFIDNSKKVGLVYTFGPYVIGGSIAPSDDGEGGKACGVPNAALDCSEATGGAYLAGIACKSQSNDGGTYYLLDENGVIWQTTLSKSLITFSFSTPTKVVDTGISTSFLYQTLYFDGTWLYWGHQMDEIAELILINPSTGKVYHAGNFGEGVWPATGFYVNGSVAPASVEEDEIMELGDAAPVATRGELMTAEVMARFAAETERWGLPAPALEYEEPAAEPAAQEPVAEEEPIAQEPVVEEEPIAQEPAEPVVEEETGTVENPAEPVEPSPIAAEPESVFFGSLNAVKGTVSTVSRNPGAAIQSTGSATEDDNAITLKLTEDQVSTNGLITVTYDAGKLIYVESRSKLSRFSVHQADGTVTFAYAAEEATGIAAGTVLAELVFAEKEPNVSTTIDIVTVERGETIGSGETPVATDQVTLPLGPQFRTQNLVLSGEIGVNFFMDLDTLSNTEKRDSYMTFAISGSGTVTGRDDFDPNYMNATKKYYGFTAYVSSIQMADTITATYHYGDGLTVEKQYSVKDYLNSVEANKDKFSVEVLDLAHAIADYGHYAQIYLSAENNWSYGEDYTTLEQFYTNSYDYDAVKAAVSGKAIVKNIDGTGIEKVTYKLYLDSGTELDVFLKPADGVEVTASASFNGRTYPAEKQSDGRYCIRIKDISAHQLGTIAHITGTADGNFSVDVCVLSYVNAILNPGWSNDAKNAVCALYKYYEATMAYRQNR